MPKTRKLKVGQKVVEMDMIVKLTVVAPSSVPEEEIVDAVHFLAGTQDARLKLSCEVVDMDVVSVKEG